MIKNIIGLLLILPVFSILIFFAYNIIILSFHGDPTAISVLIIVGVVLMAAIGIGLIEE